MEGRFLVPPQHSQVEPDVFADRSALVLSWLLLAGVEREKFSIREVAAETGVSLSVGHRVFDTLIRQGHLAAMGVRTAKSFRMKRPDRLLSLWLERYNVVRKCRMWTYRTGLDGRDEILDILKRSKLRKKCYLALHSAAEALGYKNTNLTAVELYLEEPELRATFESKLQLEPQERGYEVLLVKPYYKGILSRQASRTAKSRDAERLPVAPALLTFLDLYHFPLRGREQAEFMAGRIPELKRIYKRAQ